MLATFYNNISDDRYMNKKITITYDNVDIEYKESTGLVRPQFIVSTPLIGRATNYLYVDELKRYYYIRNITFEHQRCILDCEVDVLMTYKRDLFKRQVILERQEKINNKYQNDPEFPLLNMTNVRTINFPNGFDKSGATFLLALVGRKEQEEEPTDEQ